MVMEKSFVSLCIPVYNGEKYLKEALDSILSQTFQRFEIIISDNASTDRTEKICREYLKKDDRISYYRNKMNIGGPRNYNRLVDLASGDYFKWTAYDDILAPEYLEECVNVLDNDSSIILCHSLVNRINENGIIDGNYDDRKLSKISSGKPHERFGDLIYNRNTCWAIHGVVRTDFLKKTQLHGDYLGADRNFLAEVGLLGRIFEVQKHLFLRRDHPSAYTNIYYSKRKQVRNYRTQLAWWKGKNQKNLIVLPTLKLLIELIKVVNRSSLKYLEKLLCYREISRWLLREGFKQLKHDLIYEFLFWRLKIK